MRGHVLEDLYIYAQFHSPVVLLSPYRRSRLHREASHHPQTWVWLLAAWMTRQMQMQPPLHCHLVHHF